MVSTSHNSLKVWDLSSGVGIRMLEGHTFWVSDVAITADGQRVVSASYDRTLKVWDLLSGHSIQTLEGHSDWVRTVALTPDGKVAISGSYDGTLKVWSLDGRTPTRTLDKSYSIAITPDGRRALSGASQTFDRTAKLWDLENEFRLQLLEGHASEVSAVAITPDAKRGVCAAQTELTFWDLDLCRVAMRADGRFVISGSEDSTLKLWDVESGLEVSTLVGDSQPISALAVTTDWRLAVSSAGGTLRLWEIRTGSCIRSADTGDNWIGTVAICGSGKRVVAGSSDGMLFFWDVDRSGRIEALRGHSDGIVHVAITESGTRSATCSRDQMLKLWDLEATQELAAFGGDSPMVGCSIRRGGDDFVAIEATGRIHLLTLHKSTGRRTSN